MKRIAPHLLATFAILLLAACGGPPIPTSAPTAVTTPLVAQIPTTAPTVNDN